MKATCQKMECGPFKASSTCRKNRDRPKKVHWAFNLEEVVYFTPCGLAYEETEFKTAQHTHSMLKKLKTKVQALKNKRLPSLSAVICRRDFFHGMQGKMELLMKKIYGPCEEVNFEQLDELDKHWDELLEF